MSKDVRYERSAVTLLALGFGLVGLDRWIIAPLFPAMADELGLDYQDLGGIVGALGVAWGVSSLLMGRLSDRIGRRKVLVPGILLFSLCTAFTGLASGLFSLIAIRLVIGLTEGAYSPAAFAATAEASHPKRRGLNMGIQQSTFALFGVGLGPILATQLLQVLPSWHWVFALLIVPGVLLAVLLARVIREPDVLVAPAPVAAERPKWSHLFRHRNIPLAIVALCGTMTCIFVLSAMVPSYLTDFLHLSTVQMGMIASGIGFGAFFGQLVIPGASDRIGRRPAVLVALVLCAALLAVFAAQGPVMPVLFLLLFFVAFGANGCLALIVGALTVESVPPALTATAIGTVMGIGEIFGGGVAPVVAGYLSKHYGIQYSLYLALGGLLLAVVTAVFFVETAPRRSRRAAPAARHEVV
ncbi:MFS family permease [Saccharothrix tamanrassetensis]|uniref:MFS family permease n=1 Tax=Saccharothrix tamanrassetensis TaxID=1051531 RepID=A0A841CKW7_9PSEU|nr:MFS transporter [Saccharothrix tamanrassetensis]MBB5958171.1 MFS family permease [Saccharothrix tamanrassetensis]